MHRTTLAAAILATLALAAFAAPSGATLAPNPFGTVPPPPPGNPLVGARWFVDRQWGLAARQVRAWSRSHPAWARTLEKLAAQPEAKRFGAFTPDVEGSVRSFLVRAAQQGPGTIPILVIYRLKHVSCGGYADSRGERLAYRRWIDAFARAVGSYRSVIFLEPDALITVGCLSGEGLRTRLGELRYAGAKLAALVRSVVYLDAGAADALSYRYAARLLRAAGVAQRVLPQRDALRLDGQRAALRQPRLAARPLQALRDQHGGERQRAAAPARPRALRQRGPLQPARPRARDAADDAHGQPARGRIHVDRGPGPLQRAVPSGRSAERRVVAELCARARRARALLSGPPARGAQSGSPAK
jgi:hypothetical protein